MLASILTALIPVFLLIGLGYIFQKLQKKEPRINTLLCNIGIGSCNTWSSILNHYALYLALPALILASLISVERQSLPSLSFLFFTTGGMLLFMGLIIAYTTVRRFPVDIANGYLFGGFLGNIAYIGFAYLLNLYPASGATLSLIIAIHLIIAFTVGIAILERTTYAHIMWKQILIKTIQNPLLLSVCAGLLIVIFQIPIPTIIFKSIAMVGNSASPVVLIALGAFIAKEWQRDKTIAHAFAISGIKLLGMPLVFLVFAEVSTGGTEIMLSVLQTAMPVALANFSLAESYAINKTMIANAIIVSTVLSIITIPLITLLTLG